MARYSDITTLDANGTPHAGVYVTVKNDDGTLATLTADGGDLMGNPTTTDVDGSFAFNVTPGIYSMEFRNSLLESPRIVQAVTIDVNNTASTFAAFADDEGASLVATKATGAGAVQRTVQSKLRENVSVKDFGAAGNGIANDTAAIAAAFAAARKVHIPAGTYLVSSMVIPDNTEVTTDGFATVIKQIAGSIGTRIVSIANVSNVTLGDLTIEGQIAIDTDEQNHGLYIRAQTDDVSNIKVGNIRAVNVRGDAVYIGAYLGFSADLITIGNIICENVYRIGLTITGCGRVSVGDVSGLAGYTIVDIEPEPTYTKCDQIRIGNVKGRQAVIASSSATNFVDSVFIESLDLSPSYFGASTPAYPFTLSHGLQHRNTKSIRIGRFKASGYDGQAIRQIWSGGELATQALHIDHCDVSDCANTEVTYQTYILCNLAVTKLTINHLVATTEASGESVIRACSFADIRSGTLALPTGTSLFRAAEDSTASNLSVSGAGIILNACTRVTVTRSSLTADRLFSNCIGCLADSVTGTFATGLLVGSVSNITVRKSTIGGTYSELLFYATSTTATTSIAVNGDVNTGGVVLSRATSPSGYASGAGGTITQPSSKTGGATLNAVCGEVIMNAASLAAGASASFTLTNSKVAANDEVSVWIKSGATADSYTVGITSVSSGQCRIQLRNVSAGALAEAVVVGFSIRRAVIA